MSRGLVRNLPLVLLTATAIAHLRAAGPSGSSTSTSPPILQRFLALDDPNPSDYRALRRLDARNEHFESSAWMYVWTEADEAQGFRYRIVSEGGSDAIRSRVFMATLDAERRMWVSGEPDRAGFTLANYMFEDRGAQADGLTSLR